MGVGEVVAVLLGGVTLHRILGNGVGDLLAALVLGQIDEVPLPVVRRGNGGILDLGGHAVHGLVQADGDALGPHAVLVIVIVPGLLARNINLFGNMGVDDIVLIDLGGVTRHRILGDGVDDHFAILILRQVIELALPVVGGCDGLAVDLGGLARHGLPQVHDDLVRAQAVLIVAVVPVLHAADADFAGGVGILHIIAGDGGGIARHDILGDGIDDLLATLVLRQLAEIPGPVFLFSHDLAGDLRPALGSGFPQADGDGVGTLAVLVIIVAPGLGASDLDRLVLVGIHQLVADVAVTLGQCGHLGDDGAGVAGDNLLFEGVDDLAAFVILGQILEDPVPVAVGGGGAVLLRTHAVRDEVNRQARRTHTVVVVVVVPGLMTQHVDGLVLVGVGHIVAGDSGGVARDGLLFDGVDMLLAIGVLGQVGKAPGPAVLPGDGLAGVLLTVLHQLDDDGFGAQAVVVVIVRPGLLAGDLHGLILVGIDQIHAAAGGGVLFHRHLMDVVIDLLTAVVLGHILELPGPAVRGGDGLAGDFRGVRHEDHNDALRALAVVVVIVLPGLLAGQIDRLNLVVIDDIVAAHDGGVALGHSLLADGVGDRLAILVGLGQVGETVAPAAGGSDDMLLDDLAVRQQFDSHRGGTHAIAVMIVVPGLLAGNLDGLDAPGVGQIIAVAGTDIAGHGILVHGVHDLLAVLILGQILEGIGLGRRVGHGDGLLVDFLTVRIKVDRQVHGTHAAAKGGLPCPGLGAGDVDLLILMGVDEGLGGRNIFGGIALGNVHLAGGIHISIAIGILLRQGGPDIIPAVLGSQGDRRAVVLAVLHQLHLDGIRTDAVRIVTIVPDLVHAVDGVPGGQLGIVAVDMALGAGEEVLTDDGAVEVAGFLADIRVGSDHMADPVLGGQGDSLRLGEVEHHSGTSLVLLADGGLGTIEVLPGHDDIARSHHIDGGVDLLRQIADDIDGIHALQGLNDHVLADVDGDHAIDRRYHPATGFHGRLVGLDDGVGLTKVEKVVIDIHRGGAVVARAHTVDLVGGLTVLHFGSDGIGTADIQGRILMVTGVVHRIGRIDQALDEGGRKIFTVCEAGIARIAAVHTLHQDGAHHVQPGMGIAKGKHIIAIQEGRQVIAVFIVRVHIVRRGTLCRLGRLRQGNAGQRHQYCQQQGSHALQHTAEILHQLASPHLMVWTKCIQYYYTTPSPKISTFFYI